MTFPTYQAAGTAVDATTGTISPAWPAHQADDLGLLLVESNGWPINLSTPAGFRELPWSPQKAGTHMQTSGTGLSVFWKRATGAAEAAPVIDVVGHQTRAMIITFRGVASIGRPWDAGAGDDLGAADTVITWPAVTTSDDDCLIVNILSNSGFVTGSGYANANLANLTERIDSNSGTGQGSGFIVVTGQKGTPGSVGNTTGTLSGSGTQARITLALTALNTPADTSPYKGHLGTVVERETAGDITPAWPTHAANDIGLLVVESGGWPIATPSGWTELVASPVNDGVNGGTTGTQLSVFWKRAASGAEAAPTVTFVSDHIRAVIATIKGCTTAGNPIDHSAGSAAGADATAVSFPATTTDTKDCIVLGILGSSREIASKDEIDTWANSSLEGFSEWLDDWSVIGSGGGIAIGVGYKPSPGSISAGSADLDVASRQARITVALKGLSGFILDAETGTFTLTGQDADLVRSKRLIAETGVFALTGQVATLIIDNRRVLVAETGIFTTQGQDVEFRKSITGWEKEGEVDNTWTKEPPPT